MTIINLANYRPSAHAPPKVETPTANQGARLSPVEGATMTDDSGDDFNTPDITWPFVWMVLVLVAVVLASAVVYAWAP